MAPDTWPAGAWQLDVVHCNIRGWLTHNAELAAHLRILQPRPLLVCVNESFLDQSVQEITLEGYSLVGRRDRADGRAGGGVLLFALIAYRQSVTLTRVSETAERLWCVVRSDWGPVSVCARCRPPAPGDTTSIETFRSGRSSSLSALAALAASLLAT